MKQEVAAKQLSKQTFCGNVESNLAIRNHYTKDAVFHHGFFK